ncbi:MAG TPA: arylsulfatase, partial [Salinimicrobium sp.]|nr:arylsulfatase [Salinimicrobium sp.]
GYKDMADELLGEHDPSGGLWGGKYSAFEAGTRVPLIVNWPGTVVPNTVSNALISQVDFLKSFAVLVGEEVSIADAPDSYNILGAILGKDEKGRSSLVQLATANGFSFIKGDYKYIVPNNAGPKVSWGPDIETGFSKEDQLFNLKKDPTERNNIAKEKPEILKEMKAELERIRESGSSYIEN